MTRRFLTSESVTEGHVDKIADQISDAVLDEIISQDKDSRVDCETLVTQSNIQLTGQISTRAKFDVNRIARQVIKDIGFDNARDGLDWKTCGISNSIETQAPELFVAVNRSPTELGAGDSGVVFGYAVKETPELMPLPIMLAHKITRGLDDARKSGVLRFLKPDGKAQVTVEYEDGKPIRIDSIVVAAQHSDTVSMETVQQGVTIEVIKHVIPANLIDYDTRIIVNEKRRFVEGGSLADTGYTGRKTAVDAYGGYGSHGGSCFSGKDPTKIDRSGAYMARHIAKNVVAAGLAPKCEVQIAYALGVAEPVSFTINTDGTGKYPDEKIEEEVKMVFDLLPKFIIRDLYLLRPIYRKTATYGHFGRDEFTWEQLLLTDWFRYGDTA